MALSVSGFPEPLRQLDTDEGALNPLQRGLGLFAKKRQNTDDSLQDSVPETSPVSISTTDELAQMTILQPPPVTISSFQRPRQVSLTRRTPPPPQRKSSLGRLEIGSVPNRPCLPKAPQDSQLPVMAHPRPLPAVPVLSQGPIVESSKSAAMRAASSSPTVQPQPRPPPSRVILAAPSRPRAHTTVPQSVDVRYQSMAVDPTDTPGASSLSTPVAPPPTLSLPSATQPMTPPSGPRPLPRIPPVSVTITPTPTTSPSAPILPGPLSAAASTSNSNLQPPRQPRVKRPKTSPSAPAAFAAATRGPLDGVPSSWVSRPVDLNPSTPSGSGSGSASSTSSTFASASGSSTYSGSNAQASGSGSYAHASGSGSAPPASTSASGPTSPRSLPCPRSSSRTREHSVEAARSRSRGAASPILRSSLASGSTTAPLPSGTTTPPGSRRTSNASNPSTPRSSIGAGNRSPTVSPRVPSLPPPKLARALPPTSKLPEEGPSTSRASASAVSTFTPASTPARSQSIGPTSILKNSKNRTAAKQQSFQAHNASPARPSSPSQKPASDSNADMDNNDAGLTTVGDGSSYVSRSPSPMRYARPGSRQSLLSSDDDAHPDLRSRSRSRSQLRSYRHSYRPKPVERSPSPIAYAKRSSVDVDILEPELLLDDGDAEDELDLGLSPKQRRHTQPRSYQFDYRGPAPEDVEREWGELGKKENKEEKENKEAGGAWDTVLNYAGSRRVRKRSKSKASTGQRDSRPGTTTHTPTDSVIDITSPMPPPDSLSNRPFTPSQLNSRDGLERKSADSHNESSQWAALKKPSTSTHTPRRPSLQMQAPITPPQRSPPSSVRTRTSSDVSQHRPGHTRVKSEGSGHRARLSGVLPGVAWGADVNTEQFSPDAKLVPLRRGMYSGFEESEDEDEDLRPSRQVLDIDMVRAIPMLRRLRAR